MGKTRSFGGDALEDVVHERVHDTHGFAGDTGVRVHLLQHLVDVDSIAFLSFSLSLLLSVYWSLLTGLLFTFLSNWCFGSHYLKFAVAKCAAKWVTCIDAAGIYIMIKLCTDRNPRNLIGQNVDLLCSFVSSYSLIGGFRSTASFQMRKVVKRF